MNAETGAVVVTGQDGLDRAAQFFGVAIESELGVLLDRFGPRRVQAALLAVAALGALLFSIGQDTLTLTCARALIGLGFAGGLMSSFKAVVVWVPEKRRALALQIDVTHENRTVPCAPWLKAQVAEAVAAEGHPVFELPSGAGHDGMAMIDIADVAMIFVRCRGGISHNPAEHVELADADAGARVLLRLVENFRPREGVKT